MKTRNVTHRFGLATGMPVVALVLALAGVAPAQQARPQGPPEPPWITPPTPAPPPPPPATVAVPQVLTGHVPLEVAALGLTPIGPMNPAQQLQLAIALPLRNQATLDDFLRQLHDPESSNYRRFLTPPEFAERFGPAESDYAAVIAFAEAHNFAVTGTWPNRTLVDVRGSAADIENTFNVHLLLYQHPYEARQFYAPDVDPSVNLPVPLLSISGLNDYDLPRPDGGTGTGPGGSFGGYDFRHAYLPDANSLTGSNQYVAIVAESCDYQQSDITSYESTNHLPNVLVLKKQLDGYNGSPNQAPYNQEVSMDIEMAIAMAPGLKGVVVYEAMASNVADLMNQIVTDNIARQISCSFPGWITYGNSAAMEHVLQQFAAQGQSFFQSSGDTGAFVCGGTMDPRGDQWVTDVSGTELTTDGTNYVSERVWLESDDGKGSGGGYGSDGRLQNNGVIPWWQTNVASSNTQCSTYYRNFPDVALTATNIWIAYGTGMTAIVSGTSAATPLWAGVAALANQQAAAYRFPAIGFLNPALYTIGLGTNYAKCFHDITNGNNVSSCSTNQYQFTAVPGYDLCTGWGTPKGMAMINELIRAADGTLGCGTNGSSSFGFAVAYGAGAPSSTNYWASDVTTNNWTLLSSHGAGSNFWWCTDSTAGTGVTNRFYRLQDGVSCWRPTGFIKRQINAGSMDLVANPLDAPLNTLNGLFNPMPDGTYLPTNTEVFVQNTNSTWTFNTNIWDGSSWTSGGTNVGYSVQLSPGQGFWIYNPSSSNITVTFAGLVRQGNLTNTIASYEWIYSSMVPQAGRLQTDLRYQPNNGDDVYLYNVTSNNYSVYTYYTNSAIWWPSEPWIGLGQSFVLVPETNNPYTWARQFTTCQ